MPLVTQVCLHQSPGNKKKKNFVSVERERKWRNRKRKGQEGGAGEEGEEEEEEERRKRQQLRSNERHFQKDGKLKSSTE